MRHDVGWDAMLGIGLFSNIVNVLCYPQIINNLSRTHKKNIEARCLLMNTPQIKLLKQDQNYSCRQYEKYGKSYKYNPSNR